MNPTTHSPAASGLSRHRLYWAAVALLLATHAVASIHALRAHNLCIDEGGHLYSGVVLWQDQYVGLYHVNPPLIKALVAIPVMLSQPALPETGLKDRYQLDWVGHHQRFYDANKDRHFELLCRARAVLVLLSLWGGWIVFRWSSDLYGRAGGLVGLGLWAFCPNVLAWNGVITTDLGAAVFALAAGYSVRGWLRRRTNLDAGWAGLMVALAVLSKFTLVVLYPILLVVWAVAYLRPGSTPTAPGGATAEPIRPPPLQLGLVVLVGLVAINAAYGFDRSFRPLGEIEFQSTALTRATQEGERVNRFRGTSLGRVPTPLPDVFLLGIDAQKALEEVPGRAGYLRGEWKVGGWYHYYLYGMLVKVPLGTWAIGLLALGLAVLCPRYRGALSDELLVWLPPLAILVLVSAHTGVNSHFRYLLPALGFMFVGVSRVGKLTEEVWAGRDGSPASVADQTPPPAAPAGGGRFRAALLALSLVPILAPVWNAVAVTRIHPHYISYFNEFAGGPDDGWKHLVYSNIDWGQDLYHLKAWMAAHPEAGPMRIGFFGGAGLGEEGLRGLPPPPGPVPGIDLVAVSPEYAALRPEELGPQPGWYAVSVNVVAGMSLPQVGPYGERLRMPRGAYTYFQRFEPVAKAGYSIFIYHITPEQANAVRRDLGLPELPGG
jgi:hypothetical protein